MDKSAHRSAPKPAYTKIFRTAKNFSFAAFQHAKATKRRAIAQFDFVAFFTRAFVLFLIRFSEIV